MSNPEVWGQDEASDEVRDEESDVVSFGPMPACDVLLPEFDGLDERSG